MHKTDNFKSRSRMPNNSSPICGCGVPLELTESSNELVGVKTILVPKSKSSSTRELPKTLNETESSSYIGERQRGIDKSGSKLNRRRIHSSRRTRSAERSEPHYTYIESCSSIVSGEPDTIAEDLYATIPETPNPRARVTGNYNELVQSTPNCSKPVYSVPSMTSPPPTYDVAIAKSCQTGLPPSYEDYLCHKYAMLARSHTPPPPWSDSAPSASIHGSQRNLLSSQPELREYLMQLNFVNNGKQNYQHLGEPAINANSHQALRKHVKQQRLRAMTPRSLSETRAHQQRLATMCEDGAFCMETTAIQSAFENGVAFCCLM